MYDTKIITLSVMIYKKTELGLQAFKERSKNLSAKQRSALIVIDGKKDVTQLYALLSAVGVSSEDINQLIELAYIEEVPGSDGDVQTTQNFAPAEDRAIATSVANSEPLTELVKQERFQKAYPIAGKLTSGLGLRGFRLNMAVEGTGNYLDLLEIAPKIRDAVGDAKYAELHKALKGL